MLEAIAEAVAEKGYAATTVADVIERAGLSRKTFYEHFSNKEACFLAAFDYATEEIDRAVVAASLAGGDPAQRLRAAYEALCGTLAARPAFATAFAVVAPEAGPAAQERRAAWREESAARLRLLYSLAAKEELDLPEELGDHVSRAIIGAVEALVMHHLQTDRAETLPQIVPQIVDVVGRLMFSRPWELNG
jgi:AcrR family transcriptional regulator